MVKHNRPAETDPPITLAFQDKVLSFIDEEVGEMDEEVVVVSVVVENVPVKIVVGLLAAVDSVALVSNFASAGLYVSLVSTSK